MESQHVRLAVGFGLMFLLGVLFAVLNGYYVSETNEQLPLLVYAISLVSLMVGATLVILFQWKINKVQLERVLKALPKDERVVIKILMDNNNIIEQSKLVALSGFNKVKITRILQRLEERGVVERKKAGYMNVVVLKI